MDKTKRVGQCLTIAALVLGVSLYSPTIAYATRYDSDLDGLDDAAEAIIGTATDNADTDGDGFYDGIEYANPGLNGQPLNPNEPSYSSSNVLYDFSNIQETVTQTDNNHRLMPIFNPVDGLSVAYVVAASPGYTNPKIAIATLDDLASETFITQPGDLPSPFNFHQLTYNADGSAVLYDDGKDIYEALTTGAGVSPLTVMDATSYVFNPEVTKVNGIEYIVAGGKDDVGTALVAWEYNSSPTNGSDTTTIVDFDNSLNGQENYPRVSGNGDIFNFSILVPVAERPKSHVSAS